MQNILIKVTKPFDGFLIGQSVKVACDENQMPLAKSWRRRLKDAMYDNCCHIVGVAVVVKVPDKTKGKSKSQVKRLASQRKQIEDPES